MVTDPTPGPTASTRALPQSVLMPLTGAAIFLVVRIEPGGEEATRALLERVTGLTRSVGFRIPAGTLSCVTSIGSDAYDRLFSGPRPAKLHPFIELEGAKHRAVSTPGDLLFHIRAGQLDMCFQLGQQIMNKLGSAATVIDEVHGFKYFEMRDLLGFVDGTENPTGEEANEAVLIGAEDPDFAGGSYVIVQKYLHDMAAWNALSVEQQELVIGRTKLDDIELQDDVKPSNSHIALNVIEDEDGNELQILRDNMPFGTISTQESGTYYIAYAKDPAVTELMLRRMFLGEPEGNYDRILDFSTAATGTLLFVPTADFLDNLPPAP
ncbi:putative iron-dependent peroxidase [Kribbella orskensis]|uniref:Iron-dependent peroxidase n=1 Tax=Kribbella orskensis TaxID=2512216 RepID=A0ABY2BDR3_9ACTN|nr:MULTISPECIES: Dyp-type peroxidase [Kribbella]TCN35809.1 putative iron-dependent peroxidase [Kribbella sp. VKM Ac-2500]TCO17416.1 putative iron-dependent peroxidase [Kribbella orskensis]